MGDEFFVGKVGPAETSAAAAAAANAAVRTNMPAPPALNLSDSHFPMKVPVPDGKSKKGGGRGSKTPQKKAGAPPPAPEYDPAALAAFSSYPPPYGMAPTPYPTTAGMAPCPMPCPPMPAMYHMMPFMYPPMYPGMPNAQPPPPIATAEKGRGKQMPGKSQKDNKKRRGKAKSSKEETPPPQADVDQNCSPELLLVRNAQGNAVRAKITLQEAKTFCL